MERTEVEEHCIHQADSRLRSSYRAVMGDRVASLLHADPPYCLLVRRNKQGQTRSAKRAKIDHASVRRFENIAEYKRFSERWMPPALDCLQRDGHAIIWSNLLGRDPILEVAREAGIYHHGTFLWAKLGKGGNSGEKLARLYEVALIFGRRPPSVPGSADQSPPRHFISGYDIEGEAQTWASHPNHKPFSLLEPLLRWYSAPGEVVLEPFSGSGSTAAAVVRLGRVVRALEIRSQWARVSGERLRQVVAEQGAAADR